MHAKSYTLFATALGAAGVIWSDRGIAGVELPHATEPEARARLLRRFPGACEAPAPAHVLSTIAALIALLAGETSDLTAVVLDLDGLPNFDLSVYRVARTVPAGQTIIYGEIAARIGRPGAAREVGRALGDNPFPLIVPCHRVLGAGGKVGGFSASGGVVTKARLLSIEGARTSAAPMLFDDLPITVRPDERT